MKFANSKKLWIVGLVLVTVVLMMSRGGDMDSAAAMQQEGSGQNVATFAAGCFWCTESLFQETEGVGDVINGYAGGTSVNPTYRQITSQSTDHREAVQFEYDPNIVSYGDLVDLMLQNIDPTDAGGQFVDRGFSYTTAIFYHDQAQQQEAEAAVDRLSDNDKLKGLPVATLVLPYTTFYKAEDYHQDFYLNSAERYKNYTDNSGRKEFKEFVWDQIIEENQDK